MAVRTECTFTLKIDCTASLISVLVALGATWNTSVFWFSLMAKPFSVITGRRMIWYADFIRPPPPLFHAEPAAEAYLKLSSRLRLPRACGASSPPSSAAKSAASPAQAGRRSHGRSATDDTDALHCHAPAQARRYCARSTPGYGSRASPSQRSVPSTPPSARRAPYGTLWSSVPSRRKHSPRSACHRQTSPP